MKNLLLSLSVLLVAIACYGDSCANKIERVHQILKSGVDDGVINGGCVLSGNTNRQTFLLSYGYADNAKQYPFNENTIIDIASVTKTSATITALLICHSRGLIDFDEPFTKYLPNYKPSLDKIPTVRDLANHTSGFHDVAGESKRRYWAESGAQIIEKILHIPPPFPPQKTPSYSCWNYILLSLIIENITGENFVDFCKKEIFMPLKMSDSSLGKPSDSNSKRLAQTIGTKFAGEISDFVAVKIYQDGLASGNAGMFSTPTDISKLLVCYLNKGKYDDGKKQLFSENSFNEILPFQTERKNGVRHLGWSFWEEGLADDSFGDVLLHSGWSGQTVCFNLKNKTFYIVFTTRCGDYDRAKRDRFEIINILSSKDF